ncbi:hypothetical protein [Streptomyces sp. NPDC050263]|uniref:hypothetical protein n=1 Tax=Streptomyces sp. NPDC050263 TaxID=3155037 RepID=UPI003418EDFE
MSEKEQTEPLPRVPNGHGYCWALHESTGARCAQPTGHSGEHLDPYTPSVSW